jgi:hypothetical protein
LSQGGVARPEADDMDADRLTAALTAVLSCVDAEIARRSVEDAMLRSAAVRLDVQSAFAFVDAIEQSPQSAPAHLVDEMLAANDAGAARLDRRGEVGERHRISVASHRHDGGFSR